MPELTAILSSKREKEFEDRKFFAALQGVDIDGGKTSDGKERGQKEWEDMKARVFSRGAATDSSDVLSLRGETAKKAGIGIGRGLQYANNPKNPMG